MKEDHLCLDEFAWHAGQAATTFIAEVAEKTDELVFLGGEGSDVVPFVVGVRAGEGLAARDGLRAVLGHEHLYPVVVVGVNNGGDVEVGVACETVEAELTEHAWLVLGAGGDRVEVSDPGVGEGCISSTHAWDDEGWDLFEGRLRGEVDGSFGVVLVDEVDCVGGSEGCKRGGCEEGSSEMHFGKGSLEEV